MTMVNRILASNHSHAVELSNLWRDYDALQQQKYAPATTEPTKEPDVQRPRHQALANPQLGSRRYFAVARRQGSQAATGGTHYAGDDDAASVMTFEPPAGEESHERVSVSLDAGRAINERHRALHWINNYSASSYAEAA